jgi:hypothetical protein
MSDGIDYARLMNDAMRGLIARVLREVAARGLPGEHHFFIAFDTTHPGVRIAPWLRERYPAEMTIVLQHEYGDLTVDDERFSVTLSFGDRPETLSVPFAAMSTFADPSVEFGMRFEAPDGEAAAPAEDDTPEAPFAELPERASPDASDDAPRAPAEVVSLDKFRK